MPVTVQTPDAGALPILGAVVAVGLDGTPISNTPAAGSVTLAMMANLAESRVIGRAAGAGTGVPQALTPAQILTLLNLTGVLALKGSTDASGNPNYPAATKGDAYIITVAGKIGGASGVIVSVGDMVFAIADNAGGTQAGVGASWDVVEANIPGITAAGLAMIQAANAAAQAALLAASFDAAGAAASAQSAAATDATTKANAAQAAAIAASASAAQGVKADTALQPLTDQTKTASFTIGVADILKNTRAGHATVDIDITVPDATFTAGQDLFGFAFGAAQVAFVAGGGVTINSRGDLLDLVKNTGWQLHCVSASEFDLMAAVQ